MAPLSAEAKRELIAEKMRDILLALDLDLSNPSLAETPNRIAKMYVDEIFSGLNPEKFPKFTFQTEAIQDELILVKNIPFVSFCEHHFVPFIGKAHVAYFPTKHVLGLSKIPQIVRYFAKRPQLQERLTEQIASSFMSLLETQDVAVAMQATHCCVLAHGVEDIAAELETHVLYGRFKHDPLRSEFFTRICHNSDKQLRVKRKYEL